ncbi:MAG: DMT family transporter [Ideonella sp.]|nr:DMT family transporter [Ideonella sp.]MCC7457143.1 DMT family transporter [Nitrospira sp.]
MPATLLLLIAVAVGAAVPLQSAVNWRMGLSQGHPLYGAVVNTAVATLIFIVLILTLRLPAPNWRGSLAGPWWLWSGGLVGAAFVFGALYVAPRIGAASFAAATIFGTIVASLLIDQFGLLGFAVRPVSLQRLAGAGSMLAGLLLLHFSR